MGAFLEGHRGLRARAVRAFGKPPSRSHLAWALAACLWADAAAALDIGRLRWQAEPGQAAVAEIALHGPRPIEPAALRGRLAGRASYDVAGLIYDPRLADVRVLAQRDADGQVRLRLGPLPADARELDLLVTVSDGDALALAEFHLDLRHGPLDLAPSPPGTRLASRAGARPARLEMRAAPAAQAAAPAPGSGSRAAGGPDIDAARAALYAWAQAWSRRDVAAYLAAYGSDYAGRGDVPSRAAWLAQRRERIAARRSISVEIGRLQMTQADRQVTASFTQHYRADAMDERVAKRLVFEQIDGRWLIVGESELR